MLSLTNVDLIFKIAGIGIIIGILYIVLEQAQRKEQGQLVTLVGVVVVLMMVVSLISQLFNSVKTMLQLY
ncbi:MAG: stage III sporulation protein AC [Bacillota bacterium]